MYISKKEIITDLWKFPQKITNWWFLIFNIHENSTRNIVRHRREETKIDSWWSRVQAGISIEEEWKVHWSAGGQRPFSDDID